MNKVMAILFLLGGIGFLGLSKKDSYQVQDHTPRGAPVGVPRNVQLQPGDRTFYQISGVVCVAAGIYFVMLIRRDDIR